MVKWIAWTGWKKDIGWNSTDGRHIFIGETQYGEYFVSVYGEIKKDIRRVFSNRTKAVNFAKNYMKKDKPISVKKSRTGAKAHRRKRPRKSVK